MSDQKKQVPSYAGSPRQRPNQDVPPFGDMPGVQMDDAGEETSGESQQTKPALKQKLLDPLTEKPRMVQNMQGQVQRYIDDSSGNTLAQKLRNAGIVLLLLVGLALYGIGYLAARVYAFIGRIVLTPIIWLLVRIRFFFQAMFRNVFGFIIGVAIIVFAVMMLNRQLPTFWSDLRGMMYSAKREVSYIVGEIPLLNNVLTMLPGSGIVNDLPDFRNFDDLGAWLKRREMPFPPYVNEALSHIQFDESMQHYADLIKFGDIKRDGTNLETYLYQDLFIQDERIRTEAWQALHAMGTPKARALIKEYEMTAKAYYKAKTQ